MIIVTVDGRYRNAHRRLVQARECPPDLHFRPILHGGPAIGPVYRRTVDHVRHRVGPQGDRSPPLRGHFRVLSVHLW